MNDLSTFALTAVVVGLRVMLRKTEFGEMITKLVSSENLIRKTSLATI
jgi:hypothetical protein